MNINALVNARGLAEALHRGNSGVPDWCRYAFYGAKDRILSWLGIPDGRDIQSITRPCWSCNGLGYVYFSGWRDGCWKCNGTGIYRQRLYWLDRFKFGPYTFHRPVTMDTFSLQNVTATIQGKIEHKPFTDSADCAVSLAWLFNRERLEADARYACRWLTTPTEFNGPHWSDVARWIRDANETARQALEAMEHEPSEVPF